MFSHHLINWTHSIFALNLVPTQGLLRFQPSRHLESNIHSHTFTLVILTSSFAASVAFCFWSAYFRFRNTASSVAFWSSVKMILSPDERMINEFESNRLGRRSGERKINYPSETRATRSDNNSRWLRAQFCSRQSRQRIRITRAKWNLGV